MCSLSWSWESPDPSGETSFSLWFNRDERRARELADPPSLHEEGGMKTLMPVDPVGKGTWIIGNEHGLICCILNNYGVPPTPQKTYLSRGQLVKCLGRHKTLEQAVSYLEKMTRKESEESLAAFTLFLFSLPERSVKAYQWDEKSLTELHLHEPFYTSSSWNTEKVISYRREAFLAEVMSGKIINAAFHRKAEEGREKWSTFMTREETQTVSITEVHTCGESLKMNYWDRSNGEQTSRVLPLIREPQK